MWGELGEMSCVHIGGGGATEEEKKEEEEGAGSQRAKTKTPHKDVGKKSCVRSVVVCELWEMSCVSKVV